MEDLNKFYLENEKLVHFASMKALKRLSACGLGSKVEYEEIFGELNEVFLKSYRQYDPNRPGCPKFSTYFVAACHNHVTNKIEKMYRLEIKMDSIYQEIGGEESAVSLLETMESTDDSFEEDVEFQSELDFMRESLSPLAQKLLEYSVNPPQFILNEFHAQRAQCTLASSIGLKTSHAKEITLQFVANCLRDTTESPASIRYIAKAVEEVKQAVLSMS